MKKTRIDLSVSEETYTKLEEIKVFLNEKTFVKSIVKVIDNFYNRMK